MKAPTALVGCQVTRTTFDYQVRLLLAAQHPGGNPRVNAELVIETTIHLRDATGARHTLEPGTGVALAPVLGLFLKTITGTEIHGRGTLTLTFDDGAELLVGVDPAYESWHLCGTGVDGILVGPGGLD